MTTYAWIRETHRKRENCWYLKPAGARFATGIDAIGAIYPQISLRGGREYQARYWWGSSSGNKPENWAICGTVSGAKKWIEEQLAAFWEPPTIGGA